MIFYSEVLGYELHLGMIIWSHTNLDAYLVSCAESLRLLSFYTYLVHKYRKGPLQALTFTHTPLFRELELKTNKQSTGSFSVATQVLCTFSVAIQTLTTILAQYRLCTGVVSAVPPFYLHIHVSSQHANSAGK